MAGKEFGVGWRTKLDKLFAGLYIGSVLFHLVIVVPLGVHPDPTRRIGTAESRPSEPELGNASEGKRETRFF